jgi:CRISPR system Cascade subunit CasB
MDIKKIAEAFVGHLKELGRGELAVLRRNSGNTIESSRGVMGVFYPMLPLGISGSSKEETFFLLATLYAINPITNQEGNFGHTIKKLQKDYSENTLDTRFTALLDESIKQDIGAVSHRLRQFVQMAKSKSYGINWCQLLEDLYWWDADRRSVQKAWARAYFGKSETEDSKKGEDNHVN